MVFKYNIKLLYILFMILFIFSCRENNVIVDPLENVDEVTPRSKIYVTSPDKYELWRQDGSYFIEWSSSTDAGFVKIELLKKDKVKHIITQSTDNDGTFEWEIPASILNSNMYYIKITFLDNPNLFFVSEDFSIWDI